MIKRQIAVAWLRLRIPATRSSPLAEVALNAAGIRRANVVRANSEEEVCAANNITGL
jgi:hypothetical protein